MSLCDPLSLLGRATHERAEALAGDWIQDEPRMAMPYLLRGFSRVRLEKYDGAVEDFQAAAKCDPRLAALGTAAQARALSKQGNRRKAGPEFRRALRLSPRLGVVYLLRALAAIDTGQHSAAENDLRMALRFDPGGAEAHQALSLLLAASPDQSVRNGKKAVEHAKQAIELTKWKNWTHLDTLAAAYAEVGDFPLAIETIRQAIECAPTEEKVVPGQRMSLYQARQPYRMK